MDRTGFNRYHHVPESVITTLVIVLFLSDFTLGTLLYIVGGHSIKPKDVHCVHSPPRKHRHFNRFYALFGEVCHNRHAWQFLGGLAIAVSMLKNRSLLRAYYFYSIGLCLLTVVLTGVLIGLSAREWFTVNMSMYNVTIRVLDYTGYFVNIALQIYFVLLLRTEILKSNEFTATKAETEYMIQYKDEEAGEKEIDYLKWGKESLNQKIWKT